MQKKLVIGGVAAAVVVAGAGTWWAVDRSAEAQTTERGTCGGATWELSMDAEDGGVEVSAEIQSSGPGETWDVALLRGDTSLLEGTRTTDDDGDLHAHFVHRFQFFGNTARDVDVDAVVLLAHQRLARDLEQHAAIGQVGSVGGHWNKNRSNKSIGPIAASKLLRC